MNLGQGMAAAAIILIAVLTIPSSACSIFMSKELYGCQCLGHLRSEQMLMHVICAWRLYKSGLRSV